MRYLTLLLCLIPTICFGAFTWNGAAVSGINGATVSHWNGVEVGGASYGPEKMTNGDVESALPTMNGVSISLYNTTVAQSSDMAHAGTYSIKFQETATSTGANMRYLDGSDCGLVSGHEYFMSVWVYIPSGQVLSSVTLGIRTGSSSTIVLDETTTTDTWVHLTGQFTDDDVQRVFLIAMTGDTGGTDIIYLDDLSIKEVL